MNKLGVEKLETRLTYYSENVLLFILCLATTENTT